ncbi:iron complex outermembrane recepter protein [Alteromonadaceae bacterium Bs31]|nr:iron complex outermembrane recepter protein [Alteromonadaceae bacterium Bs31]
MKYQALAAAIMLATAHVHALEGKVVNSLGEPVAGAKIKSTSAIHSVLTNEAGQFEVADDIDELHITAAGYSHRIVHLHDHDEHELVIRLSSTVIEQVDVIGLPIHASVIESAIPIAVLSGEALRKQQAATLGDTLERQPGVNTNFHGNVASTPVIRGLSGPRVLITQNSLDVSDVSRVGPDHAVASEVSTAQQVEILRGPATLFYGSGAIGGVVNVVDQRVPSEHGSGAEVLLSHDSVNSQDLVSFNATSAVQSWAFYADGFWRDADDYEVPIEAEQVQHDDDHAAEHGEKYFVANSAEESSGFTLGTSYLLHNGFVGFAYERLDREYGIPGHSHGGHDDEPGGEVDVYADLEQDRFQLQSELLLGLSWLQAINTRAAYADYTHIEFENGEPGTTFSNQTSELRVDLLHQEWQHWKGGVNLHYKNSEISAEGNEAFTPPSTAETFAIALMEEKHIGDVLLQFGARAERVTITAKNVLLPPLEAHGHDGEGETDEHDHGVTHEEDIRVFAVDQEYTPVSLSLGAVWDFTPGYNLGFALSHAQRAPSASELLSFGPHIGTRTYEVGALFGLHEENGESHFELSDKDIRMESSNNIDLSFRKHEGDLGIILNAYFNKIDDYYYQQATGLFAESGHDHEDEHAHDHGDEGGAEEDEHADELPVFLFTHEDAEFYGLEAQLIWKLNNYWQTTFFSDFVHAELSDGRYLPRTPPFRFGTDIDFSYERLKANLSWTHYAEQDKVAELETATKGYDMVDASVAYQLPLSAMDLSVFIKAENLTDTEARVHTSFIKDVAPRPGRNFIVGLRGYF